MALCFFSQRLMQTIVCSSNAYQAKKTKEPDFQIENVNNICRAYVILHPSIYRHPMQLWHCKSSVQKKLLEHLQIGASASSHKAWYDS